MAASGPRSRRRRSNLLLRPRLGSVRGQRRLGHRSPWARVEDFAAKLRHEYDLGLALHLMVHTKSLDEDPAVYRREADGSIALWVDDTPYVGGFVCPGLHQPGSD